MNGVSKAYSMTGWRIGYAAGPKEIIKIDFRNLENFKDYIKGDDCFFGHPGNASNTSGAADNKSRL